MFEQIDQKKELIDKKRPLQINTIKSIRESLLLDWTYNSNAIEGNTLTLSETKVVLEGITIGGKTLKEHLEAVNHKEAILYVEDIVKKNEDFSEWQIKSIHRLILKGIDDENAGVYRKENVLISGATHIPPDYFIVPEQMSELLKWYNLEGQLLHVIERAALLHIIFVKIHPFIDGNGRTARLLLNLELMKNGFPPIIIRKEERIDYYNALDKAHTIDDFNDFIKLVVDSLNRTLDLYLKLMK
ncbi:Fic family protein [Serpentinicella alkaliphila]|uniref:Fic/DOC family protein n=1 Tax=Serpentinicella alkaliphila TaxID=1734049 RepID=A0A4R2SVM5_9FIRM|nr:Fic family protein [Serpentinicella alkaliphila]QUH26151.1 Fic family protein [Serpentinicella alkaliphila]TCP93550.1 Fic/DOC family protein [Serpentinicella alkaliphila]